MQRWVQDGGQIVEDLRNLPKAKTPHNKLTAQERQDILDVCKALLLNSMRRHGSPMLFSS
jgi:hypothetical protein